MIINIYYGLGTILLKTLARDPRLSASPVGGHNFLLLGEVDDAPDFKHKFKILIYLTMSLKSWCGARSNAKIFPEDVQVAQ